MNDQTTDTNNGLMRKLLFAQSQRLIQEKNSKSEEIIGILQKTAQSSPIYRKLLFRDRFIVQFQCRIQHAYHPHHQT